MDYYSKLREHRCRITEGIRVIAFRNMDHLTAAEHHVDVVEWGTVILADGWNAVDRLSTFDHAGNLQRGMHLPAVTLAHRAAHGLLACDMLR